MSNRSGFTLIELMIVIVIIAVIAAIALPNLLAARLTANESSAIATLRNIASAQAQFKSTAKADQDFDGSGEFGTFLELCGDLPIRGAAGGAKLHPAVISGGFRNVVAGEGVVSRSGYFFQIGLPKADGTGVGPDADATLFSDVDPDMAEMVWVCYAWPVNYASSGSRAFCINQAGELVSTEDSGYTGVDPAGGTWSSAFLTSREDSITGLLAVGTRAYDGNIWSNVN